MYTKHRPEKNQHDILIEKYYEKREQSIKYKEKGNDEASEATKWYAEGISDAFSQIFSQDIEHAKLISHDAELNEKVKQIKKTINKKQKNQDDPNLKLDKIINKYDKLAYSKDLWVRRAVANQGYALDKLVNDESPAIRRAVAEQGYGLDILINDKSPDVRAAVAKQGYGLDILINDKYFNVREAVAEQGYGLDKLINDKHYMVRRAVVEQGYGLSTLINDENTWVRQAAAKKLKGIMNEEIDADDERDDR